jgi:hypothetical protein
MLDSPEGVCAGQAPFENPATSVPFSNFLRCRQAGRSPPNRSSATPSTGSGESLLRADVAGGQRRGGGGEGWVRSSAWICDFSSTQHDRMRRRLQVQPDHVADSGLSSGSLEDLKVSVCQGLTSCSAHTPRPCCG